MNTHEETVVFETTDWKVVLVPDQLYLGRSVAVLKRPCGDLADQREGEVLDWLELVKKLQGLLTKTFGATMFNWSCLMNDAYQAIPARPQVHWHCRARYRHPVEFNGFKFEDPNFGHHILDGEMLVSHEMLRAINLKLQENL